MSDLSAVLRSLRPNNNWLIENETLNWEDDLALKPTDAEIEAKRIELQNTLPMKILRRERDNKLKNCDVYGLSDYPFVNDTIKQGWITYRHKLRDLPTTASPQLDDYGNLTNVIWPTPPQ